LTITVNQKLWSEHLSLQPRIFIYWI